MQAVGLHAHPLPFAGATAADPDGAMTITDGLRPVKKIVTAQVALVVNLVEANRSVPAGRG